MAGPDQPPDQKKALECKEQGNAYFQRGDYTNAEASYTKAYIFFPFLHPTYCLTNIKLACSISYDPTNPLLHTNLAMALLKLSLWARVISASLASITLLPENMKAYFYLAQAQIALHNSAEAVKSARKAHELCVGEIEGGGKGGASLGVITGLVLRCLKEDWERREEERIRGLEGTLEGVVGCLERERDGRIARLDDDSVGVVEAIRKEYEMRTEEVRAAFEVAGKTERRREVPDWAVDDITFGVMVDPVVVCPSFPNLLYSCFLSQELC
jgi:STIP1 homology and U-box containing protein 1